MRVLLASDGSEDAVRAAQWLTWFPLPAACQVRVLTVVSLAPSVLGIPAVRDFNDALLEDGRRVAEQARTTLAARFPTAEAQVRAGDARSEIIDAAAEWPADLVIVGARGLSGVEGLLMGSVSLAVARQVAASVLVVKGRPRALQRALVAVDGSDDSMQAARFFAALPLDRKVDVRLLAVVTRPYLPASAPAYVQDSLRAALEGLISEQRAEMEKVLARAASGFEGRAGVVESSVVVGQPAEAIERAAGEPGTDLVVVGARGLGGLQRVLLGSVSERVMRHAPCAVLIVKGARPR